jgi:ABC-type antimicrobial peptide transport system permease subunit
MFDVKIIEGNNDFMIVEHRKTAITQEKALQLFGKENPIGKTVILNSKEYTICAIVTKLPKQSNYPFDFLSVNLKSSRHNILIELKQGIDLKSFKKKLYEYTIPDVIELSYIKEMTILPLTTMRYKSPDIRPNVKFQHLIIFVLSGSLLILCTLFNYLTLFISRFRIRQKEMALRVVFGASGRSLFALLSTEFIISLIIALLLGLFFIETVFEPFRMLSGIKSGLSSVYPELLIYISVVILILLMTFIVVVAIFRRRNLNTTIRKNNKKLFRKISVVVQLIISISFSFCTIIIVKQMYYLHNTDLGFAFKNRGSVYGIQPVETFEDMLKEIPEITETVRSYQSLMPVSFNKNGEFVSDWEDKPAGAKDVDVEFVLMPAKFESYYELRLIEGEALTDDEPSKNVLINESAVKAFGWDKPVGKTFGKNNIVKGVVRNIYNFTPTISTKPVYYSRIRDEEDMLNQILFKYLEGTWKSCKSKIEQSIKEKYPEINSFRIKIYNAEEEYDKYLQSENTLLKILTFISLVCVIICVFGFVSLVSLTCEERRKEIAIRKINGATIKDILDIFFKEYFSLLIVGTVIAFPLGYYIMKQWLEGYVVQTSISAWIYAVILLAMILAIILCVGWKVYKTSIENPADVLKSE